MPVAFVNRAFIAATLNGYGGVVLLGAINPVVEFVIRRDVVELGRRLVVLRCPSCSAVDCDRGSTVIGFNHALWIRRIDPQFVIVAMRNGQGVEESPAIRRAKNAQVEEVDSVYVLRIGEDVILIPGPHPNRVVVRHPPSLAVVVRTIESVLL